MSDASTDYTIEHLENRRLLTASILGTSGDDTFIITVDSNNTINVLFNGVPETVNAPGDGLATVDGFEGDDTIVLLNTGNISWDLLGRSGDDSYTVGGGNLGADIRRNVSILDSGATAGSNHITINDSSATGTSYKLNGLSLDVLGGLLPTIQLGNGAAGDEIFLQGSAGDDTLFVEQMRPGTTVDMGGGHDTVRLGGTQNIVSTTLPDNSTILAGTGQDTISLDDSNAASTRQSIQFDDDGLIGGPDLEDFVHLHVKTHQLAGGQPEIVTFRGNACLAPFVSIVGGAGPDAVYLGEPGNGVFARLYLEHLILDLGTGDNRLELHETPALGGNNWRISDTQVVNDSGGSTSFSTTGQHLLQLFLNGTEHDDVYTVVDTPDLWSIEIDGRGGNDRLQMGGVLDLDDAFDNAIFKFIGGAGTDTMDLSDIADTIGDADDYQIGDFISKGDFSTPTSSLIEHSFVDTLRLHLDNDPNRLFFDLAAFTNVEIFGNGGNDTFFNEDETIVAGKQFVHTFADSMTFHGGGGNNILSLSDVDGPAGTYALESDFVSYTFGAQQMFLDFDGMNTIDLFCSQLDDIVQLREKPAGTLNFGVGAGNDTVIVGGGDLDSSGWMSGAITLSGDAGTDEIVFDDVLDNQNDGETSHYTFEPLVLSKGTPRIVYAAFEAQTLNVANGIIFGINTAPTVNLNDISGQIDATTIIGGPNRGCIVNVAEGNLTAFSSSLTLDLAGGTINFNDQSATVARTYELSATQLTSPAIVNFSGANTVNLNAGPLNDNIFIRGTAAGTAVNASGNLGNDAIRIGGGDFGNMLGPVNVSGNAGDDFIQFNDSLDTDFFAATLRNDRFTAGAITHFYSSCETIDIRGGDGGSDVLIHSVPLLTLPAISATNFSGGSGPDQVTIGTGNVLVGGNITVSGSGASDTLVLDDSSGSSASTYTFDQGIRFFKTFAAAQFTVVRSGFEQTILEANNGNNTITVDRTTSALTILANGGNDTVNVLDSTAPVTVNTGSETVRTSAPFGDSISVNSDFGAAGDTAATVVIDQSDAVLGLTVSQLGTLRIAEGGVLDKLVGTGSAFTLAGTLDLAGGAFISRAGGPSATAFRNQIIAGRNGGTWDGTSAAGAINSSMAAGPAFDDGVGLGLGSEIGMPTIGPFSVTAADVLVRYAYLGDANLSGGVDIGDLAILASNWQGTNKTWAQGDSNYETSVDINDLAALASNWQRNLPAPLVVNTVRSADRSTRIIDQMV